MVLDGRGANSPSVYGNRTARAAWLVQQVRLALDGHLDGINFDMVGHLLARAINPQLGQRATLCLPWPAWGLSFTHMP